MCSLCGGQVRIITFITHSADIGQILDHIGVESEPPRIAPAHLHLLPKAAFKESWELPDRLSTY